MDKQWLEQEERQMVRQPHAHSHTQSLAITVHTGTIRNYYVLVANFFNGDDTGSSLSP